MKTLLKSRTAAMLAAVTAFHATPECLAALEPANTDRAGQDAKQRVTRSEIASLFARELYAIN